MSESKAQGNPDIQEALDDLKTIIDSIEIDDSTTISDTIGYDYDESTDKYTPIDQKIEVAGKNSRGQSISIKVEIII